MSQRKTFCRTSKVVASFGTTDSSERVTYFQAEDVLVSNIRPYFKKMWFATTSGGCNADVLCFSALDKKCAYLLKSITFQDGFFDYVMSGAKGTKMPRGDKTHIMLYPIPRFSETQLLKFIEYNKISFGEGGRMRSLSRVSGQQRYSTLDFPAENRVPTGMQNSPESLGSIWKPSTRPNSGSFPPAGHHFFLQYAEYSCKKMASSGGKSIAVGHISGFQIDPKSASSQGFCRDKNLAPGGAGAKSL